MSALTSLAYVIAPAYNEVEIVLMAFPTAAEARSHLTGLGLVAETDDPDYFPKATVGGETLDLAEALDAHEDYQDPGPTTADAQTLRAALFKKANYYGGCGECHSIVVREVPLGQPVVAFNLD